MVAIIVERWRCQPPAERHAAHFVSGFVPTPINEVDWELVVGIFALHSAWSPALRAQTWLTTWGGTLDERQDGDETYYVLLIDEQWMSDLWACRLLGCCAIDAQLCPPLRSYGSPGFAPEPPPCPPPPSVGVD